MMIILSLICMFAGLVLYFALSFAGIYRLYPMESYALMAVAIGLAWRTARNAGGWWRYGICGFNSFMLVMFLFWTMVFSQLQEQKLPVTVGKQFIPITLTDHNGSPFHSAHPCGEKRCVISFLSWRLVTLLPRGAWTAPALL